MLILTRLGGRFSRGDGMPVAETFASQAEAVKVTPGPLPHIVSLFCGAGGLDAGFVNKGFHIELALDQSAAAISTHQRNFPGTRSIRADLKEIGSAGVLNLLRETLPLGARIGVIGGPPCQGFSRANAASRADDPRNSLVELYLKIVRTLADSYDLEFIVFENVLGIKDAKHNETYSALLRGLGELDLSIVDSECCALDFGVPQVRKRVIVIGLKNGQSDRPLKLKPTPGKKSVREAIGHLKSPVFFRHGLQADKIPTHPNHWTMKPRSVRFSTPASQWKQTRSFKRTFWSKPSPTIAFGHREIHVHPNCKRRLSIYEAMLLQGFPNSFVLEGNLSEQVEQISNAVPPPLAVSIAASIKSAMQVA
jgi:DNA (cytosine-5)-methyltransferase 1